MKQIENTCPSDPTQNGRCALINTKVDGYACKTVGGEQICRDWWRKDFTYKCSGQFDPDTILAQVGNKYCEYKNQCSEWIDVEKNGGTVSCRIYIDINRPGCSADNYNWSCIANDCGDLFDRCTLKQYVKYSDIPDRANMLPPIDCDPASGNCSEQILSSSKSGVKLGVYTFSCPSEVRKICKSYTGTLVCPDGKTQVCNKVKTCKQQATVVSTAYEAKSCVVSRNMQTVSYLKSCNPYGCQSSADAQNAKDNPLCIKTGEVNLCNPANGCSDEGSYGIGAFVRNGGTFNWLGGWNACDWGYAEVRGQGNNTVNIHAFATGCEGQCGDLWVNIPVNTPPGTVIGYVHPHWEGSCVTLSVTYDGYDCSGGGCVYKIGFHGMGAGTVSVPVVKIAETFNCYQNSFQDCNFGEGLQCNRLSSSNIDDLECVEYDIDVDDSRKAECKKYIVNYECPKQKETTECAQYEEVLRCNDGVYPIRDVRLEGMEFAADFYKAMAYAQAANELKHVWSGESYRCESGLWWLFDQMSLGDYLLSKAMGFALSYLGSQLFSLIGGGSAINQALGCANSLFKTALNFSGTTPFDSGDKITFYDTEGSQVGELSTTGVRGCFNAIGLKIAQTVGLTAEQASKILNFFGDPIVQFTIGFVIDIVTSIKKCSTCSNEKCAIKYNQYKEYSLISNRLCHYVDSKCTWKLDLGIIKKCLRTGYRYCCYNSKFARILVEQAYKQLGYSWGDYNNAQCTNLTFDDLSKLDFDSMDFSEFIEEIKAKMKGKIDENSLNQTIRNRMGM
ncbi:hypothetical protein TdN_19340 [Thermodesulfovibrio sp. TK110]